MLSGRFRAAAAALSAVLLLASASAQGPARFDLAGPRVDVRVTRDSKTLPIASVPNLQPGDKLWLFADLPRTQSVHYLLVAVFLRGTTNPPPDNWFTKIETWNKKVREEGVTITVPDEAQQALLFLAPETGGDFSTLRSAVRGRPGIFVRASQDLTEAGFEQARIEKYLASIRQAPPGDSKALLEHSNLLARTLNLRPNQDCFNRPVDQQYTCLTQTGTQTLLDDGHGQTVVSMLSNGDTSAFIGAAASTSVMGGGLYSAYVGAVVDLVRLMGNLHTAQYQYIPAIAFPEAEQLNLRLNTAPSFHNPKSVIVIGLPSIQKAVPPPLRAANARHITCLLEPQVVLPVEGAPLVFSTGFAHDLYLHINGDGNHADIPLVADAFKGGLVVASAQERKPLFAPEFTKTSDTKNTQASTPKLPTDPTAPHTPVTGTVVGYWGFDPFTGPTLPLQDTPGTDWKLATDAVLIAGRDNHLDLTSTGTACIHTITFDPAVGRRYDVQWKQSDKPNTVDVTLSLKSIDPGSIHLDVHQYGDAQVAAVTTQTFSEPAQLTGLSFHAGDTAATLSGSSLDQVRQVTVNGLVFTPSGSPTSAPHSDKGTHNDNAQNLLLSLPASSQAPKFKPDDKLTAHVSLRDGRDFNLPFTVSTPRPVISLISKTIPPVQGSPIRLASSDDLPINQQITFSLRSKAPFPRNAQIEIADDDESLRTTLSVTAGTLVLQNAHTLLATFDPLKTFGTSAYGPIRLRAVAPDGTPGDWIPLATLVRLPTLDSLHCPADTAAACTLSGSSLYLVDALSTTQDFAAPIEVPEGFVGNTLTLPRPPKSGFYLRLRDEPASANNVTMPIQRIGPPAPSASSTAAGAANSTPNSSAGSSNTTSTPASIPSTPTTPAQEPPAPAASTPAQPTTPPQPQAH